VNGHAEFGRMDPSGESWKMQLQTNRDQTFGKTAKFRLLARQGMLELYLDDYLVNCFSMVCFGSMHNVRLGILGDPKNSPVSDLQLWQMSLPGIPKSNVKLTASSEYPAQKEGFENYAAANAMDGDPETRWCSVRPAAPVEWLQVDFMAKRKINGVTVNWENAHPSQYELQVSDDGQKWRTIYKTDKGQGGEEKLSGLYGEGRYLRVYMLKPADPAVPCYSIWELAVE